jgi:hypothetical protein
MRQVVVARVESGGDAMRCAPRVSGGTASRDVQVIATFGRDVDCDCGCVIAVAARLRML